jgi:hypothetical protein
LFVGTDRGEVHSSCHRHGRVSEKRRPAELEIDR